MRCSENDFCASLAEETRRALCRGCRKRFSRAGSLEVFDQVVDKTLIVLDGICTSSTHSDQEDPTLAPLPHFSFCMPGRVLSQNVLFGILETHSLHYISMDCLTDCAFATFDHRFVRELYERDPHFARKVNESAVMIMFDEAKYSGIMRTEGAYAKVVLLMRHLLSYRLFLSNNHIAQVLACDRTTISRAIARVKGEQPELWTAYHANKHRKIALDD